MNLYKFARQNIKNLTYRSKAQFFFQKKDVYIDPNNEKIRISQVSPYLFGSLIGVSWIFILYFWYTSEDRMRIKAQKYLEENNNVSQFKSAEQEKPEEYRQEYIDKQKRKYKQLVDSRKREQEQEKLMYEDYKKFVANDTKKN